MLVVSDTGPIRYLAIIGHVDATISWRGELLPSVICR
jgi:hypothetical protein